MKAILDTHTFIWMDTDPARLTRNVLAHFADPSCDIYLSTVSEWEVIIKVGSGKLTLSGDIHQVIRDIESRNPLKILPIQYDHTLAVRNLPPIHKDPFDRMLVAQAMVENAVLLSCDPHIRRYPVTVVW